MFSATDVASMISSGELIHDPVGQRPPVSSSLDKSIAIMSSLLRGMGVGMIAVRDISNDPSMQKVYPGAKYVVIDGGHRCRAIYEYSRNKLRVDGFTYRESDITLDDFKIPFDIRECNSKEACDLFRAINDATAVNRIESLMANDESKNAKFIRLQTSSIREYEYNKPKAIFSVDRAADGSVKSKHWSMEPNHRRKWDEWIAIFIASLMKKEDDKIEWNDIVSLIEDDLPLSNSVRAAVDRFLDDVLEFRENRKITKLNGNDFDALMTIWLGFYHYKTKEFRISDSKQFAKNFMYTYSKLTGVADTSLDNVTIKIKGSNEPVGIKEWFRQQSKNHFAPPFIRKRVFEIFMKYFDDSCIVYRTEQRSVSTRDREKYLAKQGYVCAIDGKPLDLDESVWGHDTPWAQGGELTEGAVIRIAHNTNMGSTTLSEYRMILKLRKKGACV